MSSRFEVDDLCPVINQERMHNEVEGFDASQVKDDEMIT